MMNTTTELKGLVKRSMSLDPAVAAEAKAQLEALEVQFKAQKRSGVETR